MPLSYSLSLLISLVLAIILKAITELATVVAVYNTLDRRGEQEEKSGIIWRKHWTLGQ